MGTFRDSLPTLGWVGRAREGQKNFESKHLRRLMPFFLSASSLWWAKDKEGLRVQAEKQSHKDAEGHS